MTDENRQRPVFISADHTGHRLTEAAAYYGHAETLEFLLSPSYLPPGTLELRRSARAAAASHVPPRQATSWPWPTTVLIAQGLASAKKKSAGIILDDADTSKKASEGPSLPAAPGLVHRV